MAFFNWPFIQKNQNKLTYNEEECDPQACYDSFKEHWHQASRILQRVQQLPNHDDVLGVVNHLEQMSTLILVDLKKKDNFGRTAIVATSKCLEHLLTEHILDKLFDWSTKSGQYKNVLIFEQLKLYEMLINQTRVELLLHKTFLKCLIDILMSCQGEIFAPEIGKLLVDLLNQLSALLMQNLEFIDLFFVEKDASNKDLFKYEKRGNSSFIIFSLLLKFVHRDDSIGMKARDALLLCMSLSKKNKKVAIYIAENTDFSLIIASGFSALFSELPNVIEDIVVPDWHRFTPDDVNEIKGLSTFVTSLEFSNAVAQVAHQMIRKQLQDYLLQGFLKPVLGSVLLQSSYNEQVAATAYFELILRTVTQTGLLHSLLKFLLVENFDDKRLIDVFIDRINSERQLCLVTLAVFESLVNLNCEDVMLELVFKHLQPCLHLVQSQRRILLPLDPYCQGFEKLLSLAPSCCDPNEIFINDELSRTHLKYSQSLYGKYYAYLKDARSKIGKCQMACMLWSNSYNGSEEIHSPDSDDSTYLSLEASSGYQSFATNFDDSKPYWEISSNARNEKRKKVTEPLDSADPLTNSATAGPFLTILLEKLKNFLSNSIYINLHLTGLISRLAVYPQPLLRAYLLDHSIVLQPNVPSIFEIISSLKQKIDEFMNRQPDKVNLIKYARDCLIDREIMLVNLRRYHAEQQKKSQDNSPTQNRRNEEPFQRNRPHRVSLTLPSSIASMFTRRASQFENSVPLLATPSIEEAPFTFVYPKFNKEQHVALCAVLLDEWVKELAALAQEHTIAQLANLLK